MSQGKHTPGPWGWGENENEDRYCLFGADCNTILEPELRLYGDGKTLLAIKFDCPDNATDEANARLIAAAPDLLAACEAVVAEHPAENGRGVDLPQSLFAMLNTAIARAKAESEQ
ncbi:MAG: hypothetical protein PHU85_00635 [Phycisphaerae bacterium]|nr:hypothetical protein [Phycisphaerae bacterium]